MADKYEVLNLGTGTSDKHAVMESNLGSNGRTIWTIVVPDAGHRNIAAKIARLLNKEYEEILARENRRKTEEL
jgi:predicted secreted protein